MSTIYFQTILNAFAAMDIVGLRVFLKDQYTYERATKETFLEKLEAIFEKHRNAGDTQLLCYTGVCSSELCVNCGNKGYRFVGNNSKNYIDLLFDIEGDSITDICSCLQFRSDKEIPDLRSKSVVEVNFDERATFTKTPSYWSKVYAARDAYKEIITTPPRKLDFYEIVSWLSRHSELYVLLGDYNPFKPTMKWSEFHSLYSDFEDIQNAIFDNVDRIILANKEWKNVDSEEQLVDWALKYEDIYHAGTLNLQLSLVKIGEDYGYAQFDKYLFAGDVFAEVYAFFHAYTPIHYELLNKYTVFTSEESDEFNKREDWHKEDGERLKLSFHIKKRKQLEELGITLPYYLQGDGMPDENIPFSIF